MTQPSLKPGILWPLPSGMGKILDIIETAVRSALQEDELPVAQLGFIVRNSCPAIAQALVSIAQRIVRPEVDRRRASVNIIYPHGDILGLVDFHSSVPAAVIDPRPTDSAVVRILYDDAVSPLLPLSER